MKSNVVSLSNVSKVYLSEELETRALWDIDLEVGQGEFLAITGPSGCGKSTLLSIIGLMDVPTAGSVLINGQDVTRLSLTNRAKLRNQFIGFVFQSFHLVGNLTALQNAALPLLYAGADRQQRRDIAAAALTRVGMQHRMHHYPAQLSGGQQQRVAIARAIAGNPTLLLADEPTGNLDSENGTAIMRLLTEIHQQGATTICLVTHQAEHAKLAERNIRLLDGEMVSPGVRSV